MTSYGELIIFILTVIFERSYYFTWPFFKVCTSCHLENSWTSLIIHPNLLLSSWFSPMSLFIHTLNYVIFFHSCTKALSSLFTGFSNCQHDPRDYHFEEKIQYIQIHLHCPGVCGDIYLHVHVSKAGDFAVQLEWEWWIPGICMVVARYWGTDFCSSDVSKDGYFPRDSLQTVREALQGGFVL